MKTTTFVALLASAPLASATYDWSGASPFSCPGNTPTTCVDKQKTGFDWSDLNLGSFTDYSGFKFSGFSCSSSFGGGKKRDQLTGRTFGEKCITGSAGPDVNSSPSFSCGGSKSVPNFSVDEFHITPEFDCDLQFHYTMPDKSVCKQTSSCQKSGTIVKNTQCGGATAVTVVYPEGGKSKPKPSCSIGIHSVGFHCSSTTPVKPTSTSTPHTKPTTYPVTTTSSSSVQTTPASPTSSAVGSTTSSSSVETTPATSPSYSASSTSVETTPATSVETTPASPTSSAVGSTTSSSSVETTPATSYETTPASPTSSAVGSTTSSSSVETTPATSYETTPASPTSSAVGSTTSSSAETTPASPTSSAVGSTTSPSGTETSPVVYTTTVVVETSTTVCPVTTTHTTGGTTSIEVGTTTSTILITSTHTTCNKCDHAATPTSTPAGVSPSSSTTPSGPAPTAPCPEVLPQCLNTWMFSSECSSNTDASCYCKSEAFVCSVFDCLTAHGSDADMASAQSYFQGICAPYVDVNSAIVTCANPAANSSVPLPAAVTTIQVVTTVTVPCSASGSAIPSSSTTSVLSTALTVPQVVFQTQSSSAALVVGTPAAVPAGVITPTGYTPAATTLASVRPTSVSNGTTPTGSPSPLTANSSSQLSMTFGSIVAAFVFTLFAM